MYAPQQGVVERRNESFDVALAHAPSALGPQHTFDLRSIASAATLPEVTVDASLPAASEHSSMLKDTRYIGHHAGNSARAAVGLCAGGGRRERQAGFPAGSASVAAHQPAARPAGPRTLCCVVRVWVSKRCSAAESSRVMRLADLAPISPKERPSASPCCPSLLSALRAGGRTVCGAGARRRPG